MKRIILILFVSIALNSGYSQKNFEFDLGTGTMLMNKTGNIYVELTGKYYFKKDVGVDLSASSTFFKSSSYGDYRFDKLGLHGIFRYPSGKMETFFGFSMYQFSKSLELFKKEGMGMDLGIRLYQKLNEKIKVGTQISMSYMPELPSGVVYLGIIIM